MRPLMLSSNDRQSPFWRRLGFWVAITIGAVFVGSCLFTWLCWGWLHNSEDSRVTTVRNVGLLSGGIIAIVLAIWRSLVAERQADTAEQGLLNERYQRAADMLGSSILAVRLGGIDVLRRLAETHPKEYHVQSMILLCAFIRNLSDDQPQGRPFPTLPFMPRDDIHAAIKAVGARSAADIAIEKDQGFLLELYGADLNHVFLIDANLAGANLMGANLGSAVLVGTDLSDAIMNLADLSDASIDNNVRITQQQLAGCGRMV